ncbi:Conserved_hypothetical protein [Hexamita inflata]|uniref:Uncharacterized protein n=1 Tax=Hexamita inflata TaxID=28002 RepID=A0ABP1HZ57_9EUKA
MLQREFQNIDELCDHFKQSLRLEILNIQQLKNLLKLNVSPSVWTDASQQSLLSINQEFVKQTNDFTFSSQQLKHIHLVSLLSNLTSIDFYNNQISDISALSSLKNIKTLYLTKNCIVDISALQNLTNIIRLHLASNKITKFQISLPNLVELQIGQNQLEDLSGLQLWEVELLFLVYYVSNYILKYFATSNADDKFQQIISSWRLFMNYSLTQEGQKYDFDRIRPQSTIQSRYLIFQKGKIEITTCNKGRQ